MKYLLIKFKWQVQGQLAKSCDLAFRTLVRIQRLKRSLKHNAMFNFNNLEALRLFCLL